MSNIVISFSIPAHLIKPYMQRMLYINTELKRGIKKLKDEGYELTPSENELIRFDVVTNSVIYKQIEDALVITESIQSMSDEQMPQTVRDEVDEIMKKMMSGND